MKTYKKIVIFLFSVMVLLTLNDLLFSWKIPQNSDIKPFWMFNKSNQHYDIAIIGSSRTYTGINTNRLVNGLNKQKGINLSMDGTGYPELYLILQKFLKKNSVDTLLIGTDLYSLGKGFFTSPFHPYYYFPFIHSEDVFVILHDLYGIKALCWKYIPFLRYAEYNSQLGFKQFLAAVFTNEKGFELDKTYGDLANHGQLTTKAIKYLTEIYPPGTLELDPVNMKYFNKIIKLGSDNDIKIILVNVPEYYKIFENQINRDDLVDSISNVANTNNLMFLEVTDKQFIADTTLFANFTHLNQRGAEVFTDYLLKVFTNPSKD
jgi:hypothetical protein